MAFQPLRHRFLWRLRAPMGPGEVRRIERWLATSRVFLATAFLVTVLMNPRDTTASLWGYGLLTFYLAQAVVVLMLLRFRQESTASFRLLVHSGDVVWPALMWLFYSGQGGIFLLFVFVLAAAAYRWGLWETAGTAAAAVLLLCAESFAVHLKLFEWIDQHLASWHWAVMRINPADMEAERLFMRSAYLVVMGLLLGYLAEQQKQLRAEKAVIADILGKASVEAGLTATLQDIIGELLSMYGANSAVLASREINSYRVFVAKLQARENGAPPNFEWLQPGPEDRNAYLFDCPGGAGYAVAKARPNVPPRVIVLDQGGSRLRNIPDGAVERLSSRHAFHSLMWVCFTLGNEWEGRFFLLDPALTSDTVEELRFLLDLVRQIGPAIYNVYLLRRLRMRAGAVERARFARELHDGAVQSLIAVEMQVDVLRRQASSKSAGLSDELSRIQGLLREEVLKLRELMQQMKSLDVDAKRLLRFLGDTVERFQRETGISARFVSELEEIDMPPHTCRELARIVQEGLVNVRKHSRARQVLVRLTSSENNSTISIEDDGCGFPFSGRLNQNELDALGKGPLVIKERVRLIEGELTVESNPGRGSRLEITVPLKRQAAYG